MAKQIDLHIISNYLNGKMSALEKHAFESQLLDDPFLREAVEGYEKNPEILAKLIKSQPIVAPRLNRWYMVLGLVITTVLSGVLVMLEREESASVIVFNDTPTRQNQDTNLVQEYIPLEIDSLELIADIEQIKPNVLAEEKTNQQQTISYPSESPIGKIVIEEDAVIEEELAFEPEDDYLEKAEFVPASYLSGIYVVDYRRIKRERSEITYKKYTFTGVDAAFENQTEQERSQSAEEEVNVSYWEYLADAMEQFSDENYKPALVKFETILEQYPGDLNALFYGGLTYYNLGKFNKAKDFFTAILEQPLNAFKEEAAWYKVKAHLKLGEKQEARNLLDEIIAQGGFYAEDAIQLKKGL